ncbi:MAG: hypothetical protein OEQ28_16435 [Acidobacteriota bacterium]|nr:hypothetical protein [Acidobacteriota bacterium]
MKRLVVSAIFVSVFFIGISGLIQSASARFLKDDKAMELIRASRAAIGGDQNLAEVRSMTIKGTTVHYFEKAGVQDVKQGALEINFELPGKFSKRVKMGTPGIESNEIITENEVDLRVIKGDVPMPVEAEGKENVVIVRKGDGKDLQWVSKGDGDVEFKDGKVFVKKEDGTVEELKSDGDHEIIIETEDGDISQIRKNSNENTWVTDDGRKMRVKKDFAFGPHGGSGSEMLRTTMALLMTAPEDGNVTFKYAGKGDVDGFPSNIVEVGSHGSSFKLYLDVSTNLPQMVSYPAHGHHVVKIMGDKGVVQENRVMADGNGPGAHEKQIKFSDFRSVGGLLLPHRWTETSEGKILQTIDITGYEINPANIAERFGNGGEGGNVIIKKRINKN